jgi:transcriptional regulator with XRE-family HTH domain
VQNAIITLRAPAGTTKETGPAPASLGEQLRQWRTERRLTRGDLAHRAGIAESTLSRWEAGRTHPGLPELEATLRALERGSEDMRHALQLLKAPRAQRQLRQLDSRTALLTPSLQGELLWAMRQRKGWTQTQAAQAAGVTQAQITRWEKGDTIPDNQKLHTLCWHLGAQPEEVAALCLSKGQGPTDTPLPHLPADSVTDEEAWRSHLYRLIHRPFPDELTDLVLIATEKRLGELSHRHDFAPQLLPAAYAIHTRLHLNQHRAPQAMRWAERGLSLARTVHTDVFGQSVWFGNVTAFAIHALAKKQPANLRRALQLLHTWLPQVEHCAAHHAWGSSLLAKCQAHLGYTDEAVRLSLNACQRAERALPVELPLRMLDHAQILSIANRPKEALHYLDSCRTELESRSALNFDQHRALETKCLIAVGAQKQ